MNKKVEWLGKHPEPPQDWEKEFEEYAFIDTEYGDFRIYPDETTIGALVEKYLHIPYLHSRENYPVDYQKIKIKCKDGCIQIERIS